MHSLVSNAEEILMTTVITEAEAFRPTRWFGVDVLQHIDNLKLVMMLERGRPPTGE
jgi:hypothetical protein